MTKSQLNMLSKNVKSQLDDFKCHLGKLVFNEQEFIHMSLERQQATQMNPSVHK